MHHHHHPPNSKQNKSNKKWRDPSRSKTLKFVRRSLPASAITRCLVFKGMSKMRSWDGNTRSRHSKCILIKTQHQLPLTLSKKSMRQWLVCLTLRNDIHTTSAATLTATSSKNLNQGCTQSSNRSKTYSTTSTTGTISRLISLRCTKSFPNISSSNQQPC